MSIECRVSSEGFWEVHKVLFIVLIFYGCRDTLRPSLLSSTCHDVLSTQLACRSLPSSNSVGHPLRHFRVIHSRDLAYNGLRLPFLHQTSNFLQVSADEFRKADEA